MTEELEIIELIKSYKGGDEPDKVLLTDIVKKCLEDSKFDKYSSSVKLEIFTFIKSFIKTSDQAKKWIDEDNEALILNLFLLRGSLSKNSDFLDSDWSLESLKCLANSMLQIEKFRLLFEESEAYLEIIGRLEDNRVPNPDFKFLYYRLLYLSTLTYNKVVETLFTKDLKKLTLDAISTKFANNNTFNKELLLTDWLKILFNLHYTSTKELPQKVDDAKLEEFSKVIPDIIDLLKDYPPIGISSPGINIIHILMNFKPETYKNLNLSNEVYQFLTNITLKLMESNVDNVDEHGNLSPVIMFATLLTKSSESSKELIKASIIPESSDRKKPLGFGETFSSKFIGLLTQATNNNLKESVGELLFYLSDENGDQMVSNFGYGNCAGYLVNNSIPFNIPDDEAKNHINPITGQLYENEALRELQNMTMEEKEREAEKLFVLFERMKKNPAINIVNPVELAQREGKLENLPDSDHSDSD